MPPGPIRTLNRLDDEADQNHLPYLENGGNRVEDIGITLGDEVFKVRHLDEHDLSSIDDELFRKGDSGDTQPRSYVNAKVGTAGRVDKLGTGDQFTDRVTTRDLYRSLSAPSCAHNAAVIFNLSTGQAR